MDQVLLPLVIGLDETWDTEGSHGPVRFPQSGAGSEKKCFMKLCLYHSGIQPNITVIFWVTGKGIVYFYN